MIARDGLVMERTEVIEGSRFPIRIWKMIKLIEMYRGKATSMGDRICKRGFSTVGRTKNANAVTKLRKLHEAPLLEIKSFACLDNDGL